VRLKGPQGERTVPVAEFHRLPGERPQDDTVIAPGELVTGVDLPPSPFAARSHYLKVRDRASYAFALVSVAVALDLEGGIVRDLRLVLGGVAHKPWRSLPAEDELRDRALDDTAIRRAATAAVVGAKPYRHNAFKVELAQAAIERAVRVAGAIA
jgi:xanthine dehydrogenase YagS FAD-binding subunit